MFEVPIYDTFFSIGKKESNESLVLVIMGMTDQKYVLGWAIFLKNV